MDNLKVPQRFRYIIPIVDVLKELGGSERSSEVIDVIMEKQIVIKLKLCLLFIILFIQGCATTTTIYANFESDPSGASIYGGETPVNMEFIGVTPKTVSFGGENPLLVHNWHRYFYQFKKEGYYDSEIIEAKQLPHSTNRNVWAILKKKSENIQNPDAGRNGREKDPKSGSGTGFLINSKGYLVTNDHVVRDCNNIEVVNSAVKSKAQVLYSDEKNDIAVLKIDANTIQYIAYFRSGKPIRAGDDIVTVGFPFGSVLGSDLKVTKGNISSMTGINNDTSMLQFSAPVQPGNSGGPLLDAGGNVVGVVTARLNDLRTLKVTGSLPQNVNFAIKNQIVQLFLGSHAIEYLTRSTETNLSAADVAEQARKYTLNVQCTE